LQTETRIKVATQIGDVVRISHMEDFFAENVGLLDSPREMHTAESICKVPADPYFELSMICCAFLIADSSGALSFFRMSIAFCAEAMASFWLPSLA